MATVAAQQISNTLNNGALTIATIPVKNVEDRIAAIASDR